TSDYSDHIATVSISVTDIDDASTGLTAYNEPPLSAAGLVLTPATPACVVDNTLSPNPAEDGSVCSWTYDGQVLDPGDNVHAIDFTPSDGDGDNDAGKDTHTLTIEPEDATVLLDDDNPVATEVETAGGTAPAFTLYFSAWETNDSGDPVPDDPDFPHDGTAADGDFTEARGYMTLAPVGPGGPVTVDCNPAVSTTGTGYGEVGLFECNFPAGVEVNVYEVIAQVDGETDTTAYYRGSDEDAFVVFDPSLGFTTGGGWFYWPDTAIDDEADPCDGYPGDKTNFGYVMKYNKKGNQVKGNALVMRHVIDPATCLDAGSFRVKSNALYGLAIGEGSDADGDYGWAAFAGKATYRPPGGENEGNHQFLIYAEDHGDQGCGQDPSDRFWIQVKDKDDLVIPEMQVNGPDGDLDAEDIQCGNIYVPHTPSNGKP
ncbi:MAG: hypothetical protein R3348_04835, partial [Xanthomonadales bacterium]|nr:hypothetical protein [Xanthomonadales bacterium]